MRIFFQLPILHHNYNSHFIYVWSNSTQTMIFIIYDVTQHTIHTEAIVFVFFFNIFVSHIQNDTHSFVLRIINLRHGSMCLKIIIKTMMNLK